MNINAGNILIAEPFLLDPNFKRSVILICEHHEFGTTGLMLNKPIEVRIHEIVPEFPESDAQVYIGGPVETDRLHFLHNVGHMLDDTLEVSPGIFWGGDFEKLQFLMENGVIKDNNVKFFLGYSGWSEGQLEDELKEQSWIVDEVDPNYLFKIKPVVLWQTVLHNKGDRYTVIAQIPDTESLN
ncbi:MAG TPA: YqgE/AlgH family protein [Saprospiraceae bacterium]|jgi:putative transcriptional regulator|nr:YqgE/AlgH family protein [Saprospiraceae bacterium]HRO07248.1 YqgE/AlgH family protein [Saprospiraceae bacterium]HRP40531.1 YqgE/AlgH family protein [Saprospiraceae bacterium]